jgi:NAD+ synthase (glutamine-hydrolysing)
MGVVPRERSPRLVTSPHVGAREARASYGRGVKIALVQRNLVVGDFDGNVERLLSWIGEAAGAGADLAICSELAVAGYPPRDLLERPAFVDQNLRALDRLARAAAIPAIVGFIDRASDPRAEPALHNAAAVIEGGEVTSVHHKTLLPTYDVFDEWRYFAPGERRALAEVGGVKVGVSICEDIWNDPDFWPVRRYRRDPVGELAELGAELLVNVAASPFTVEKRALRARMLSDKARKHRLPLATVNQVGGNDDLLFDGGSSVYAADGAIAARAREFSEDLVVVEVDLAAGTARGPVRETAPLDEVGDLSAALDALILGTRDYARKCGFSTALVGLSGGVDSALTAAVAAAALGPESVLGVSMPSRFSSEHSRDDAAELAANLGIRFETIPIEAPFQAFLDTLAPIFAGRAPDVAEENLQARSRAVLLMALSNKLGHLLLTTGNKSELAVGYCTLYGDMSGGLAVLSDVPKTTVYRLAREVNRRAGREVVPRSTLEKPPSAELRPDQTDQDSLPPYEVLDAILELHVEDGRARAEIVAGGHAPEIVDAVVRMVRASEYKRYQAAPGLKISGKAFGPGRRMPLAARWRE